MGDVPTTVPPDPATSTQSEWHTIRPWTPHLTLAVREITSVSATFILSLSLDGRHTTSDEPEPEPARDASNDTIDDAILDSRSIIADTISHGLSVDVNGSSWKRVFLRTNDHADEVIIFIYGLHPGRQYDIDMALVSGGTIRKQVTTEDAESGTPDNERNEDHHAIAAPEALSTSTSNGNESLPSVPSTSQTCPSEERLRTLLHQLNVLHSEQATLQASLKSSRRDANKITTGLRAEIDVLKRASEKNSIAEAKARQRVRALEDAVKRANEGRDQVEKSTSADEQELPGLTERQLKAEEILKAVKSEADMVREERMKQEEELRKRKESMKGECATLSQRLERLTVKKDKQNTVIEDLEAQLAEIQQKIDVAEQSVFQNGDAWDSLYEDPSRTETQQRRLSHPGTIGRPVTQRTCPAPVSSPHFPRHQSRSQSTYRTSHDLSVSGLSLPPGLPHPSGHSHLTSSSISHSGSPGFTHSTTPALSQSSNTIFSQSTSSSSLSRSTSSVGSSTLSSKAPPFEPTRNFRVSLSSTGSSGWFSSNSGLPSMSSQGSFSSSSSMFPSIGSGSGFSLSGSRPPAQKPPQASRDSFDADLQGGGQVKARKSPTSKGSGSSGEDGWCTTSNT